MHRRLPLTLLTTIALCSSAFAADWPMWRHDANRSAVSPEGIPESLNLQWEVQYTPRTLAWDDPLNQDMMHYDRIFEPIVVGKTMMIPFNDTDKLVALDTETGMQKWAYYVDGPIRFPAAAADGKVYFTSDDGFLYCLEIETGTEVWKFRGAPSDRKLIGNRRFISVWPARGGPVVKDGTVYFGASIWPMMGIFIYAIDAETGEVQWFNDGTGAEYQKQPHNSPAFAGVAPQGAMVAVGDRLLVPGGRSVPACFDRNTGELLYYRFAEQNKTGGAFVAALGDDYFNHHRERVTTFYQISDGDRLIYTLGKYPVLAEDAYVFSGENLTAYAPQTLREHKDDFAKHALWTLDVDATKDLVRAGNFLYAANADGITAVRMGETPAVAWQKRIDGGVERLLAADDKLFAVTLDGSIMAFGAKKGRPQQRLERPFPAEPSMDAVKRATDLLNRSGVKNGYAIYYGVGDGELMEALAANSDLHIVGVVSDPARLDELRDRFDLNGLYGDRVALLSGKPGTLDTPDYMAGLTILGEGALDKTTLDAVFPTVRPYGGVILPLEEVNGESLTKLVAEAKLPGLAVREVDGAFMLAREGALPGAGTWTHQYGNIANTTKSDDSIVKLPLGVLWFGGSSNMDVLPRHGHGPPEQVIGGRLFIQGMTSISARDVYTGQVLWTRELQDLGTFGVYFDATYKDTPTSTRYNQVHIPGANIRGTNYVATEDFLYVIQGGSCHLLDVATGETAKVFNLPPIDPKARRPKSPPWGFVGVYENLLIGGYGFVAFSDLTDDDKAEYSAYTDFDHSASKELHIMDRHTGELLWKIPARHGFLHNAIAVGKGTLFCMDKLPQNVENKLRRRGVEKPTDYRLMALDMKTGEVRWETQEDVFGSFLAYSEDYDKLIQSTRPSKDTVRDETGKRMIAYKGSDGSVAWDVKRSYGTFPVLHNDMLITKGEFASLETGLPLKRENPLTGEEEAWTWARNYGCNYPIASENLLTFRSAAAGFYDLANGGGTGNFGGFKSSCTSNLVVADGVMNAPDYTRTCNCAYQNQTSLALVHMPEMELWTFNTLEMEEERIERVGINFGAPGDRVADNGTLWLDYPNVGGPSPELDITLSPEAKPFRSHASRIREGELPWVAASGVEDCREIAIRLNKEGAGDRTYTVRLLFSEPAKVGTGDRVFDVTLQNEPVLDAFDVAKEAAGPWRSIVKEVKGVSIADVLKIGLAPAAEGGSKPPILSGVEIIAEDAA
jgi:outer membrane protein assembly factor BamB